MHETKPTSAINRREFLQAAAAIAGSLAVGSLNVAFAPPPKDLGIGIKPVPQYMGSQDGYIYESLDGGKTWHVVAYFGDQYKIQNISLNNGWLIAEVYYNGDFFKLKSQNGRMWYSQNYNSPGGIGSR